MHITKVATTLASLFITFDAAKETETKYNDDDNKNKGLRPEEVLEHTVINGIYTIDM